MPPEMLEAMLCEHFQCLPSELDQEDGDRLLTLMYAQSVARAFGKLRRGEKRTPGEAELIRNIKRAEL